MRCLEKHDLLVLVDWREGCCATFLNGNGNGNGSGDDYGIL